MINLDNLELMSIDEVAASLGCGRNQIYEMLGSGELKGFRRNRGPWKITRQAVIDYLCKQSGFPVSDDPWTTNRIVSQ